MLKIGEGFDIHKLVPNRPLILGGVNIPFNKGSLGHSDGDAVIHAIIDALVGALALGDIGKLFPDDSVKYININSRILLKDIATTIDKSNYKIGNIDSTIIIEKPTLKMYIDDMRKNIAEDLNIGIEQVSVKAKTFEGITVIGRGEAIMAKAVALLIHKG